MKNHLFILFFSLLFFLFSCEKHDHHKAQHTRVLTTQFEINDKVVVKCKGAPCIYNTRTPKSLLSGNAKDPLNVGIAQTRTIDLASQDPSAGIEEATPRQVDEGPCYCGCNFNKPCSENDPICEDCSCDCDIPCDPETPNCGGGTPPDGLELAGDPEPIMNEDSNTRFLGPQAGLIDDYIAFSVNRIDTRSLKNLYATAAVYNGSKGNYFIVKDQANQYVAVVGTQDPGKTLLMRSPSFALLAVGGLQNTTVGGEKLIGGQDMKQLGLK